MASAEDNVVNAEKSTNEETPNTVDGAESGIRDLVSFPQENDEDLSGVQGDEDVEEEEGTGESTFQVEREKNTEDGTSLNPPEEQETSEKHTSEESGVGGTDGVEEGVWRRVEKTKESSVSGRNAGQDGSNEGDDGTKDEEVAVADGVEESIKPSEESAVSEANAGDQPGASNAEVKESDAGKSEEEAVLGEEKEGSQGDEGQVEAFEDEIVKENDPSPEMTAEGGVSNIPEEDKSDHEPTDSELLKDTPTEGEDVEHQIGDDDDALLEMEEGEDKDEIGKPEEASSSIRGEETKDKSKTDDLDAESMMEKWNLEGEIEGDGDDGFQEAVGDDELMETDEFDELENAIKRQSENNQEDADEGSRFREDSNQDDDNLLSTEPMEDDDEKDAPMETESALGSKDDKESQEMEAEEKAGSKEEGAGPKEAGVDLKEVGVDAKEQGADMEEGVDSVEDVADSKEEGAGSMEDVADSKEESAGSMEDVVDSKEKGAGSMEDVVDSKEKGAGSMEDVVDSKEKGAGSMEDVVDSKEEGAGSMEDVVDSKEEGTESKEEGTDKMEEGADSKEEGEETEKGADSKEKGADTKEEGADLKEEVEAEGGESEKKQIASDGEADSKDQLSDSQEMWMQYDGEDLLETMVSDEDSEKQTSQTDGADVEKSDKSATGTGEAMEVDSDATVKVTEQSQEADKTDLQEKKSEDKEPSENVDEADIIDMIEERTISPLLKEKSNTSKGTTDKTSEAKSASQGEKKPSRDDVVVVEDEGRKEDIKTSEGDTTVESTEEGDKSKDSSLSSSEDKRRRSGGISISSIVSRLTQNLSEKKPEKEDVKLVSDKSMPVITQVKTLAQDSPKEKVGRKQVYKKEDVVNRCSQCFNPFLSLNPIKHNNAVFCSTDCLQKKTGMSADSLACTNCKTAFQPNSTGSCTLKVGMSQKSFCSQTCKNDYQKRAKPCSNCGEDISGTNNAFMAQVGDEGKFMEFCSQSCVETYEKKLKEQPPPVTKKDSSGEKKMCSMCLKMTLIKHEVKFRGSYFHMCGPECFANFRRKNNLSLRTCNQCGTTCYNEHSPGEEKDGHKVFFCSQKCLEVFQHSRALSEPCFSCKTMYKQGMLIEGKSSNGKVYKFCSQDCLKKGLPGNTPSTKAETLNNSSRMKTTNVVSVQGPRMATQVQVANVKPVVQPKGVQPSGTDPAASAQNQGFIPCNHCKKVQRPLYHLTMSDSSLRNFCSYPCVIAFQAQFNVPPVTLPQETLLLRCGQCQRGFSHRPKTLDYQGETRLFCADSCLEDFKRTQSVIAICDCCFEEKILFEETNFLGKARYFCSPGCSLIFKNQFVKRIGLRCAMCDYCSTMCKVSTVSVLGGIKKRFCGDECKESYNQWYNRMARCEGCKRMGCELTESFRWRGKVKRVCNEQCLLLFYTQQNVPDMGTQLQSELNPMDKATENGVGSVGIPTITNVKSLAGPTNSTDVPTQPKVPMAHKQTQITTNTIFVKPPPPPPTPPPPAPKQVKNKITLCKPYAVSKSVTCKPITKNAEAQADFEPVFVPVPVPIFVPVPMQMYTTPVPQPFPIPIPVPTPMFVPVAYSDCDRLMESIEEVMNTIPSDPLEADILMMATAIAGKEESTRKPPPPVEPSSPPEDISDLLPLEEGEVPDLPNKFLEGDSDIAGMLAEGLETLDSSDLFPEERVTRSSTRTTRSSTHAAEDSEPQTSRRSRTRGAKRVCLEALDDTESSQSPESVKEDVRPDIGPAAYSFYLQQMEKAEPVDEKLKPNLTLASVDELHYCLCRFVKEARQPDGEMYTADTLYLILLSIQKYLMTNKRKENIFMDPYFVTFSNLLHDRLAEHTIITDPMADLSISTTCLDEEFLWESKQLGAHSPSVLLSTILYFCTKELMLKTVAMHKDLAFCRVQRLVRKDSKGQRTPYVRFIPSPENSNKDETGKSRKRPLEIDYSLELKLNPKQPLRCPVKLHEFYLSKCPENVKNSMNTFYVVPERACVPDSPLWYSDKPMSDRMIERYLYRHLMVKDVHEYWEMLRLKKEEGSEDSDDED